MGVTLIHATNEHHELQYCWKRHEEQVANHAAGGAKK
jgi:hypothetical protein